MSLDEDSFGGGGVVFLAEEESFLHHLFLGPLEVGGDIGARCCPFRIRAKSLLRITKFCLVISSSILFVFLYSNYPVILNRRSRRLLLQRLRLNRAPWLREGWAALVYITLLKQIFLVSRYLAQAGKSVYKRRHRTQLLIDLFVGPR